MSETQICSFAGYIIAYIEPGGLVDRDSRFAIGDEIVNVNGQSLRGLEMEVARNVLRNISGTHTWSSTWGGGAQWAQKVINVQCIFGGFKVLTLTNTNSHFLHKIFIEKW
jgi:hypothetical protein